MSHNKLSEKLVKASEVYAQCTWLRALINIVPHIGSSLDIVLASRGGVSKKRMEKFLMYLKEEMSTIKEDMIDRGYIESEEFSDILLKVIDGSLKSRDQEKILLYAKFLKGVVLIQDRNKIPLEDYLATLVELTPIELEVARAIYFQQCDSEPRANENELQWARRKGWDNLSSQVSGVSKEDLQFVLLRTQKSGLIRELTGAYLDYGGGVYVITSTFRKLMHFIRGADYYTNSQK